MNAMRLSIAAVALAGFALAGCTTTRSDSGACSTTCACAVPPGKNTSVDARTADALRAALQDERNVQAFYKGVMAKHGSVRPFANIVHAEARHESALITLMNRHDVPVPPIETAPLPAIPDSLKECQSLAAQLERDNIALYDRILIDVTEPDIRATFENLRAASKNNHLPAFERWSVSLNSDSNLTGRGAGLACARPIRRGSCVIGTGLHRGPGVQAR